MIEYGNGLLFIGKDSLEIDTGLSEPLISLIQESCSRHANELKTTQLQKLLLDVISNILLNK